ncbi:carbohydrate ABC transporter permease [Jiangella asiatica]|uniref:Carbohydrate ABC transporter permease n=1 Tax=Jiangella asiatica TaxID=2530372 RepID=A0A4R5CZ04_9ACTN|nr:carbohydrate ABC transporter permease [Jiangella asiatica]TDE03103.1 carbohydrate ABC transporter permease [Jiangella asiatica]
MMLDIDHARRRAAAPGRRAVLVRRAGRAGQTWLLVMLITLFALWPLYWMVVQSLQPRGERYLFPPQLLPTEPTFAAFSAIWESTEIVVWLRNTLVVAVCSAALTLVFAAWGAYAMSRWHTRGVGVAGFLTLATQMMPGIVLMIPIFKAFIDLGLVGGLHGLVVANFIFAVPVATWMLKSIFDTIPEEIEEAARVDGCNRLGVLFRITLPLALPGVVATGVFAFIASWNEYMFARLIITRSTDWVGSMGIASFFGELSTPWPEVMAAALVFAAPPVVLFLAFQKYFVAGLAGASK